MLKTSMIAVVLSVCMAAGAMADVFVWRTMLPGANPPGEESLWEQCLVAGWSIVDCDEVKTIAVAGQHKDVQVADGTQYDVLIGRAGSHGTSLKGLGDDTPARRITIANGKTLDWYTGFAGACNNVATNPQFTAPHPKVKDGGFESGNCRWVEMPTQQLPGKLLQVSDFNWCGCNIPGVTTFVSGGTLKQSRLICDDAPEGGFGQ